MTTIAWDGKILACDSRSTSDSHIISDQCMKIYKLYDIPYLGDKLQYIAMSGAIADFDKLVAYLHSDDFPGENIRHNVTAIIIGRKYAYNLETNKGYLIRYRHKTNLAEGSGCNFALAGMCLGLNAIQAVKLSIKLDSASGGKVRHVTVK